MTVAQDCDVWEGREDKEKKKEQILNRRKLQSIKGDKESTTKGERKTKRKWKNKGRNRK